MSEILNIKHPNGTMLEIEGVSRERFASMSARDQHAIVELALKSAPTPVTKTAALASLEVGLAAFCKAQNITKQWNVGLAAYRATAEGRALYDAYEAADDDEPVSPIAQPTEKNAATFDALERGLTEFCKSAGITKVWTDGIEKYRKTDEGRRLSDEFNESH